MLRKKKYNVNADDRSIGKLERDRLRVKLCAVTLVISVAVMGFCAAYVAVSSLNLLSLSGITVAFFLSLTTAFLSVIGGIVCCVALWSSRSDLEVTLSPRALGLGDLLLKNKGEYLGSVKLRIILDDEGNTLRNRPFSTAACCAALFLSVSLVAFAVSSGLLYGESNSLVWVLGKLVTPDSALSNFYTMSFIAVLCGVAMIIVRSLMLSTPPALFVTDMRISKGDIKCIGQSLDMNLEHALRMRIAKEVNDYGNPGAMPHY